MLFFSNTKINLGLTITSKRDDGYHNIKSIFYPIPFGDCIEFIEKEGKGNIDLETGGIKIPGDPENNLVSKAYKILNRDYNLPSIQAFLLKNIPAGSGIGGGSSDGAWMLKGLNKYFQLGLTDSRLREYALELGSDCPYFIQSTPSLVKGRGELLQSINLDLSNYFLVLLHANIHISTAESYSGLNLSGDIIQTNYENILNQNCEDWKGVLINDFEAYAFSQHPILFELKNSLYDLGACYSAMSGTGSVIYGIFKKEIEVPEKLKTYMIWSGML